MAAYAALVSLMNVIFSIQNHPRVSTFLDKEQTASLCERVDLLLDFVENCFSHGGVSKEEVEDLERQIASAAHEAEDVIESHIVDRIPVLRKQIKVRRKKVIKVEENLGGNKSHFDFSSGLQNLQIASAAPVLFLAGSSETSSSVMKQKKAQRKKVVKVQGKNGFDVSHLTCWFGLQKVIQDMDSIKEKVLKFREERGSKDDQKPPNSTPAASSIPPTSGKASMVGLDAYLHQLLDWLTGGQQSDRRMIPITGMGGIGKTTLAKVVYENSLIVQHFDVRAWVTVSQQYDVTKLLSEILSCLPDSTRVEESEDQLGEQLHKILFGRRYLVVLDDMWSIEAWDKIKFFFPVNDNTSRIVVTTRQSDVANHCGSLSLAMDFLNDDGSWRLFCEKTFAQENCPQSELEVIGKRIVKKCKGLPLAIVVIGGLLRKSPMTQEYWETVEKDLSSILNSVEDNQCLNILSMSYSHLPAYLKPCFLYVGTFPEDHKIRVSQLVKLLVAEGFVKPHTEQRLEEVAMCYIKDLVDRNLLLVHALRWNGKLKTCGIHDLLRDLCIKVAEKEKFFCVMRELDTPRDMDRERRIIIDENIAEQGCDIEMYEIGVSLKSARSIIGKQYCCEFLLKPKLLRVISGDAGPVGTNFQQVNLRFLENDNDDTFWKYNRMLDPSVSLLWNLQTLILKGRFNTVVEIPSEIWEMSQLRHFRSQWMILPDPPQNDKQECIGLRNLLTLGCVEEFRCSEEVYKRLPNIRKLHISVDYDGPGEAQALSYYCHHNLACLNKLEVLLYKVNYESVQDGVVQNLRFPSSLKKLTLEGCNFHWDDVTMIGSLPHLEYLELGKYSVKGSEWNPVDGEFFCLKYLRISNCDLEDWNAESSHFPFLEELVVERLLQLNEIPLGIGEITTLQNIYVNNCSVSAAISTMEIVKEQENLGNVDLQVRVELLDKEKEEIVREKMEEEGFTSPYFQLR